MSRKIDRSSPAGGQISPPPLKAKAERSLNVGASETAAEPPAPREPEPQWVQFGSYLPAPLLRKFKIQCVTDQVQMKHVLAELVEKWLADKSAS